jgi:hypothetical protein
MEGAPRVPRERERLVQMVHPHYRKAVAAGGEEGSLVGGIGVQFRLGYQGWKECTSDGGGKVFQ